MAKGKPKKKPDKRAAALKETRRVTKTVAKILAEPCSCCGGKNANNA